MTLLIAVIGDGELEMYWVSCGKNFLIYSLKAGQHEEVNFDLSTSSFVSSKATISAPKAASATS